MSRPLDLVAIGRVSGDLYGQQLGSRLEDVATFAKGVGGCPANVAIGAARLGLKSALITRVGDEPMGHFVREQLEREGVDTRAVHVDRERLTPLVLLGVRDRDTFPSTPAQSRCAPGPAPSSRSITAAAAPTATTSASRRSGRGGCLQAGNRHETSVAAWNAERTTARDVVLHSFIERYAQAYEAEMDAFVAAIAEGQPLSPDFTDGVEALRLAVAAGESLRTGRVVDVGV